MYGPGRPPSWSEDFQAPYADSWITTVEIRPGLVTANADSGRQRAHSDARDASKRF